MTRLFNFVCLFYTTFFLFMYCYFLLSGTTVDLLRATTTTDADDNQADTVDTDREDNYDVIDGKLTALILDL